MSNPLHVDLSLAQEMLESAAAAKDGLVVNVRLKDLLLALHCNGHMWLDFNYPQTTNEPAVACLLGRSLSVLMARPMGERDDALIGAVLDSLMAHDRWKLCMHEHGSSLAVVCSMMYLTMDFDISRVWFVPRIHDVLAAAMADPAWPFPGHKQITAEMLRSNVKGTVETLYLASIDPAWLEISGIEIDYLDSVEIILKANPPLLHMAVPDALDLPALTFAEDAVGRDTEP